jgi:hypothetical protein
MARIFSQNGGKLTLQKDNVLAAWRLPEKGRFKLRRLDSVLKDFKVIECRDMVEESKW